MAKVLLTVVYTIGSLLHVNVPLFGNRLRAWFYRSLARLGWHPADSKRFRYVDADGTRLRMLVTEERGPTVVFEAGGPPESGSPLESWRGVQNLVSQFASTVSYDRAGIGFSAKGPRPRDARRIVHELRAALRSAGIEPPYVLVGASFGGPLVRVFAATFPEDVGGIVLLDPLQEEEFQNGSAEKLRLGVAEKKDFLSSLAQAHESRVPENVPVVMITPGSERVLRFLIGRKRWARHAEYRARYREWQSRWLEQARRGKHVVLEDCGHHIAVEAKDVVASVVREMVDEIRRH